MINSWIMFQKITREKINKLVSQYATDTSVLDIGAGGSVYGKYFPNRISVDIDPLRNPDIIADAHALPFKDGEYVFILCTEVLEHLKNPQVAIREMSRVLDHGGVLLLTTRFVYPIHDSPNDYWRFTKYGLQELFSDWEIVRLISDTENFSTIAVLLQRIIFQTSLRANRLVKVILTILTHIFRRMDFLTRYEYGEIGKKTKEKNIMPSGYFLVCRKK